MQDVMQEATSLISVCLTEIHPSGSTRFFSKVVDEEDRKKLNAMGNKISCEMGLILTDGQHNGVVEEDLLFTVLQEEEDLLVPEQLEEDLLSTGRQEVFKMEALKDATNNFQEDRKVGEGGFGAVYKGTHDGKQIAVKKMSLTSNKGRKVFMNEKLLAEVQHRNLVNLLGSCEQESEGFLVYEYFPNKSLDQFLSNPENREGLDWHKRYNIIQGIARGLLYLHEDSQVRIVHGDIKPSNILLDERLNPKIADFGTAKLFPEDETHVIATTCIGTPGYMPPEYLFERKLSVRTDVYSFGIVLLELITGEKISSTEFLERVWCSYKKKEFVSTIDPTRTETEKAKALRCIQVGLLSIQKDSLRPTMSQVITMLSTSENLPVPENPLDTWREFYVWMGNLGTMTNPTLLSLNRTSFIRPI